MSLPGAMMGGSPPPGLGAAPPPSMGAPQPHPPGPAGGIGPVSAPQQQPGNAAAALPKVKNAIEMLQQAMTGVPLGTPLHSAILKAISDISKHLDKHDGNQGLQVQDLVQLARQVNTQSPQAQALQRMGQQPQPPALPAPPPGL